MRRKKAAGPPIIAGAPEWMVTFGDLMSLLLTFFVLLFSVSEVKDKKIYDMIKSFENYFQIVAPNAGMHLMNLDSVQNFLSEVTRELPDQSEGHAGLTAEAVESPLGKDVSVATIDDNLVLQIEGSVLFDENSAAIREEGRELLGRIRGKLAGYPNLLKVVGHCSPLPLPEQSEFADHMELGFRRAMGVRAVLMAPDEAGANIEAQRLEVATRGDQDRLPGVDPFDKAQRARLDRVEIIVTPYRARRIR